MVEATLHNAARSKIQVVEVLRKADLQVAEAASDLEHCDMAIAKAASGVARERQKVMGESKQVPIFRQPELPKRVAAAVGAAQRPPPKGAAPGPDIPAADLAARQAILKAELAAIERQLGSEEAPAGPRSEPKVALSKTSAGDAGTAGNQAAGRGQPARDAPSLIAAPVDLTVDAVTSAQGAP